MEPTLNAVLQACERLYAPTPINKFADNLLAALKPVLPSRHYSWELLTMADMKMIDARCDDDRGPLDWSAVVEPYREFVCQHPYCAVAAEAFAGGNGRVAVRSELSPAAQWDRTDFRNLVLSPLGIGDQQGLMFGGEQAMAALVLHYEGGVPEASRRVLRLLAPHIQQAMAAWFRWDEVVKGVNTATCWGRIRVGFDGRVEELEPAMHALLARHYPGEAASDRDLPAGVRRWVEQRAGKLWSESGIEAPREAVFMTPCGQLRLTLLTEFASRWHVVLVAAHEKPAGPTEEKRALATLTSREREVLQWVAEGKRNGEIAIILGSRPSTVKSQVETILRKLGAETRGAAAAMWREAA